MPNNSTPIPPSYTPTRPGTSSAARPTAPGSSTKKRFASAYVTRFFKNWVIISVALLIALVAALGYNTITRSVDIGQGFTTLGGMLGGVGSMLSIIGAAALIGAVIYLIIYMGKHDYTNEPTRFRWHFAIAAAAFIAALVFGIHWINLDQNLWGTLWVALGFLALSGVTTFMVTRRH